MRSNLNIFNMSGGAITHAVIMAVLAKSNLHWEMHHAQVYALDCMTFIEPPAVLMSEVTEDMARELLSRPQTNVTLMGLPVIIDNERYPKSLVRLMSGEVELARIEMLGIPQAFAEYGEEETQRERGKWAKLTY